MLRYIITITTPLLLLAADSILAEVRLEEMLVTTESGAGTTVGEATLLRRDGVTLGAALSGEPGIVNQSSGPGVGRPVIRGQGGSRVRILQNALGAGDLSALSPDHAVAIEPLLASAIEVLRGPSTLRYGSGLLGGAVNVHDGRIPETLPVRPLELAAQYRFDSPQTAHGGVVRLDAGAGPFVLHLDGLRWHSGDLRTGRGVLEHTGGDRRSASVGMSWIGEQGFIGTAVNRLENAYGVPTAEAVPLEIDLKQTRHDLRAAWFEPFPGVEALNLAFGHSDYRHAEIEAGQRGTLWTQRSYESRVELNHMPLGVLSGSLGFQSRHAKLAAIGEEAIVPPTETATYAGFLVERWERLPFTYEWALRVERQRTQAEGHTSRRDLLVSGALSAAWHLDDRQRLSLAYTSTERAPQPGERYAFGVHAATQSFEIGDPDLNPERSHQLELSYRFQSDRLEANITLFHHWVHDYIFFRARGDTDADSGLPVFTAVQEDAIFKGFEAQFRFPLLSIGKGDLDLSLFGDMTRGRLAQGGDVPRMPPLRYGAELNFRRDDGGIFLRLTRAEPQNHPGRRESSTPGYVLLNLGGEYHLRLRGRTRLTLFAQGTNLLDQTIRNSTSFLRTIAPEAGRGIQAGVQVRF